MRRHVLQDAWLQGVYVMTDRARDILIAVACRLMVLADNGPWR